MRQKPWFKSFATLLAVWFPLVIGEPSLLQPCPTHGATVVASATAPMTGGHGGHAAAAEHGSNVSQAAAGQQDSSPDHSHHDCTCIGCCSASLSAITTPSGVEAFISVLEPDTSSPYLTADLLPRPGPDFSRPY